MISSTIRRHTSRRYAQPAKYQIRLKISPADREDAWEICRAALDYGGVEIDECCFAFVNEEQRLSAWEALRFRFGPEFFQPLDSAGGN